MTTPVKGHDLRCHLCHGAGSLFCMQGSAEWYECPACGGAGVRAMVGPRVIEVARFPTADYAP